jgi:hypothetical protein
MEIDSYVQQRTHSTENTLNAIYKQVPGSEKPGSSYEIDSYVPLAKKKKSIYEQVPGS